MEVALAIATLVEHACSARPALPAVNRRGAVERLTPNSLVSPYTIAVEHQPIA
ncbi:hypothetical protein [Actinomadura sp. SCN-SB]|uniref:hypothetical protein n=1 Tax=Actinomadura sp. SCN-SB TaxID=3373092 RepID=UPI003751665C